MTLVQDHPIVLGLAGKMATGKTVTAYGLAPMVRVNVEESDEEIIWDHLYFAMPLYRMASVRQTIEGYRAYDRMCYEIHDILVEIFGNNPLYGAPGYRDLIDMTLTIVDYPCPREGKPRDFLQYVGTGICREYEPNCWVNWIDRKVKDEYRRFLKEYTIDSEGDTLDEPPLHGVVVSDCRFQNEIKWVKDQPNGVLVKFVASPGVVEQRLIERDGTALKGQNPTHRSETDLDDVDSSSFDAIIDTSNMSVAEQVEATRQVVSSVIKSQPQGLNYAVHT